MSWQIHDAPGGIDVPGLDAYTAWHLSEARGPIVGAPADGEFQIPVLIELGDIALHDFADLWRGMLAIPPVLLNPPAGLAGPLEQPGFVTAAATPAFFDELRSAARGDLRATVRSVTLSRPVDGQRADDKARELQPLTAPLFRNGRRPEGVVVGIIDNGIAFAHRRFRKADNTTRFDAVWLQSATAVGHAPTLFGRGREILAPEIDGALQRCTHAGAVDEDEVYQSLRVVDFASEGHKALYWRLAHGTHVLDTAAGADPAADARSAIVAVELPTAVTADTSGMTLAHWAIEGVLYILMRSLALAGARGTEPMPVVINLSYGFTAGPHDGTHPIERALVAIVELWQQATGAPVRLVLPAGNHRQARLHASVAFGSEPVVDLPWRIQPDDHTPSHVEIWLPQGFGLDRVGVSLLPPEGTAAPSDEVSGPHGRVTELRDGEAIIAQIACQYRSGQSARGLYLVTVAPTAVRRATARDKPAPAGMWTIRLRNRALAADSEVHAWIQRDDSIAGFAAGGRQSYFDDPGYPRFDEAGRPIVRGASESAGSSVARAGSLNAIATSDHAAVVVVGGYVRSTRRAAAYSGSGPTCGARSGPDALAVSDASPVAGGTKAAGTRSGSVVSMNGTSTAAPAVTRLVARVLQSGGTADASFVRDLARAHSAQTGETKLDPSLHGAGLLPDDAASQYFGGV